MILINRLRLLGPVQIEQGGLPLPKLGSQKSLLLLAYLVSNPQEQSRARLAALLWPDQLDEKARSNLRWAINNLADLLPNAIEATRHTIRFQPSPTIWVDLFDFARSLHENQPEALAAAVELYRGDFLDGMTIDDSSELELWLLQEREKWRQLVITTLERLIQAYRQQQTTAAHRYLARLLSIQPWHEEAHRQLMHLLASSGQKSAALAQFDLCRKILVAAVAAEPAEKTLALYQQIQAGAFDQPAPASAAPPPRQHNLPRARTPFVGRAQELVQLCGLIRQQARPLISLMGEGGVGKTRLALATAQALLKEQPTAGAARFPDGIWFVPLAGVEAGEQVETTLATAIAEAIQVSFAGSRPPPSQLLDSLRDKQLLLLLDNFEHLLESAPFLSQILDHAPQSQLLVTTRSPLALDEEWRFPLLGLAVPQPLATGSAQTVPPEEVAALAQTESLRLFVQAAQRLVPAFAITAENGPALVTICRYVRGLPLAIELAATWLAHLSCQEIAQEIQQGLNFLTTTLRNVPERHRNMRAVFEYSWRLLAAQEQQAALELAIFRDGCERPAALAITQQPLPIITALLDKSMLQLDEAGRYVRHALLHQFCLEKLQETISHAADHFHALHERHSAYYLAQLRNAEQTLKGDQRLPLVQQLRRELDNLRQGWRWALTQRNWPQVAASLPALALFYVVTGLLHEGSNALHEGIAALQADQDEATQPIRQRFYANLLIELANVETVQGHYASTLAHLATAEQQLLQLPPQAAAESRPLRIRILVRKAEVAWYKGEIEAARILLQQALDQLDGTANSQEPVNQENHADILCLLGLIAIRGGAYGQAIDWYDQSHLLSLRLQDAYRIGRALYCLGTAYRNQGQYERARHYLLQGLALVRATGDSHSEGRILNTLGDIELYRGDFLAAQRHYQAVARFAHLVGDRRSVSIAQTNLGLVERELGRFTAAEAYFQQSRAGAQAISFQRGEGWNLLCLSLLHQQTANYGQALAQAQQAATLFEHLGDRLGQAHSATNVRRALVGLQQMAEARQALERAYQLRLALHQPHLAAEMGAWLAYVAQQQGDTAQAMTYLHHLLAFIESAPLDGMEEPIRVCLLCAQVLQAQDNPSADTLLAMGHALLERRAGLLGDTALQASYRQQVPAHVQLQATQPS